MEPSQILDRKIKSVEPQVFPEVASDVDELKENTQVFSVDPVGFIPETEYFHAGQSRSACHLKGVGVKLLKGLETNGFQIPGHASENALERFRGQVEVPDHFLETDHPGIFGFLPESLLEFHFQKSKLGSLLGWRVFSIGDLVGHPAKSVKRLHGRSFGRGKKQKREIETGFLFQGAIGVIQADS
jgi:hypothetical protein